MSISRRETLQGGVSLVALALGACGTQTSQQLLADGQLAVTALQTIDNAVASLPGAPVGDTTLVALGLGVVQAGLTALQQGKASANSFATIVQTEVQKLAGPILTDLKANSTIVTGFTLLQGLVQVIVAEVTPAAAAPTSASADVRGRLQAWVNSPRG